jgi:hypothetical protein
VIEVSRPIDDRRAFPHGSLLWGLVVSTGSAHSL